MHAPIAAGPRWTPIVTLLLVSACGDPNPADFAPPVVAPSSATPPIDGTAVYLARVSARCHGLPAARLAGVMGTGVEFSAEQVRTLLSPCVDSPHPGIDVDIENGGVVFDFSNVDTSGHFPHALFEGYVLHFSRECGDPIFTSAAPDVEASSANMASVHIDTHFDRLEVDFAGVDYDQETFLKVDLSWEAIRCLQDLSP